MPGQANPPNPPSPPNPPIEPATPPAGNTRDEMRAEREQKRLASRFGPTMQVQVVDGKKVAMPQRSAPVGLSKDGIKKHVKRVERDLERINRQYDRFAAQKAAAEAKIAELNALHDQIDD